MKNILVLFFLILPLFSLAQCDQVKIFGTVKDYSGHAIDSANVLLLDRSFEPVSQTISDAQGRYQMEVKPGDYYALAAVNMKHYGKSRLEFWAWNIPAHQDIRIDARYNRMEVYALNAFRPQGAHPSFIIYFRPMSLTKALNSSSQEDNDPIHDIAPDLDPSEIKVLIDGQQVEILSLQKVREYNADKKGKRQDMYAYLIQTSLPKSEEEDYHTFRVILHDRETGDRGEAVSFKPIRTMISK